MDVMRSIAILTLALLGAVDAPSDPAQSVPETRLVLPKPASERNVGRRLLDRLRGPKSEVPPPSSSSRPVAAKVKSTAPIDPPVRRTQGTPGDLPNALVPGAAVPFNPAPALIADAMSQPITMEAALYGAITSNPDLVSLRQGNEASAEAVEVARRFPTTMNPTLWIDIRPLAYERVPPEVTPRGVVGKHLDQKDALMYFSLRQPIELGNQRTYRHNIAKAAYSQQQWTVLQAELTAIVQTYRLFQTAAYRREKLRVARELSEFNDKLAETLRKRLEANQVQAADVALSEVEAVTTRQAIEAARQDYAVALADLQNQLGVPQAAAVEPLGEFILPGAIPDIEDQELVTLALHNRPDLHATRAAVQAAYAAVCLAKGDRVPTPVVGPVYERDEQGTQFFGFVYITPIPVLNNGMPLVRQREAEHRRAAVTAQQLELRATAQVKAAVAKWNVATQMVSRTQGLPDAVRVQIAKLEKLFDIHEADFTKLLQARRSLIQLENARLDALWQATQAQADLLQAVGTPSMITALQAAPRIAQSSSASSAPRTAAVVKPAAAAASAPALR
jgi:cobalt-zinc-cadmium efflux system outer membrane protein